MTATSRGKVSVPQKFSLAHGSRRDGTSMGLLFARLTGIVGSGWLLGAMETAQVAGV